MSSFRSKIASSIIAATITVALVASVVMYNTGHIDDPTPHGFVISLLLGLVLFVIYLFFAHAHDRVNEILYWNTIVMCLITSIALSFFFTIITFFSFEMYHGLNELFPWAAKAVVKITLLMLPGALAQASFMKYIRVNDKLD